MNSITRDDAVPSRPSIGRVAGLALAALTLGLAGDVRGQQLTAPEATPLRSGFHFSIGLGAGSVSASCEGCEVDFFENRLSGFSGTVQLGGAVSSRLVIAVEGSGWLRNEPPIYRRIAAASLVVLGYPGETAGFFVKGGFGGLRAIIENDFVRFQTDAWTAQTGIGYDIPIGGAMLTPYATYERTFGGTTWFNGIVSPVTALPNAIHVGMALTVHQRSSQRNSSAGPGSSANGGSGPARTSTHAVMPSCARSVARVSLRSASSRSPSRSRSRTRPHARSSQSRTPTDP